MKLTKKQVLTYISLFEDNEKREKLLEQLKIKGNKWYVARYKKWYREDWGWYALLYNTTGYDDEIGIYWYETILNGGTSL